jgi:hypothetical protein
LDGAGAAVAAVAVMKTTSASNFLMDTFLDWIERSCNMYARLLSDYHPSAVPLHGDGNIPRKAPEF